MTFTAELAERLVDALNRVHGKHDGFRANHARGLTATGSFTGAPEAAISAAAIFSGVPVPVTVRFSNGSGVPERPDYASDGRGMAVKFELADGRVMDMVGITLPVFFARTPESFIGLMHATAPDPATGQPDLAKIGEFFAAHPESARALETSLNLPRYSSYLDAGYNGLHAFIAVDSNGRRRAFRYRWEPEGGVAEISRDDARERGRDYLQQELAARLESGPAAFRLVLTMAQEGDTLVDSTEAWPEDRERITAGRLELTGMALDQAAAEAMLYDPTVLIDGLECSEDPLLNARSISYAVSYTRRRGLKPVAPLTLDLEAEAPATAVLDGAAGVEPGSIAAFSAGPVRLAVANVAGELHAIDEICTHRQCSLVEGTLDGAVVTCPCHRSQFDVTTGAVVRGPATIPVRSYPLRHDGDTVEVSL